LLEHWAEKIASLVFVTALWLAAVPGSRPFERTFPVPVDVINLPPGLVLDEVKPSTIDVTLAGLRREFYLFAPRYLRVTIDASMAAQDRRTFQVLGRDLRYPKSLTLEGIEPDEVKVSYHRGSPMPGPTDKPET